MLCHLAQTRNVVQSGRSLKHSPVAEILLFEDSDNDLSPSDSDLAEGGRNMHKKQKNSFCEVILPKMQCFPLARDV